MVNTCKHLLYWNQTLLNHPLFNKHITWYQKFFLKGIKKRQKIKAHPMQKQCANGKCKSILVLHSYLVYISIGALPHIIDLITKELQKVSGETDQKWHTNHKIWLLLLKNKLILHWSNIGQFLDQYWSNIGNLVIKISNIGPIIIQYWTNLASVRPLNSESQTFEDTYALKNAIVCVSYHISSHLSKNTGDICKEVNFKLNLKWRMEKNAQI